jgi:hypothetical protein
MGCPTLQQPASRRSHERQVERATAMKKVVRNELLSFAAYEEIRPHFRGRLIEQKRRRRMAVGEHMTLVFENHDSVLLQVQEMLRTERISDERAIAHELETYNELVPEAGCVTATQFIEYDDKEERARMLQRFASLRSAVSLCVGEDAFVARFASHFGEELDRLPAVNYLTFELGSAQAPRLLDPGVRVRIEVAHPDYAVSAELDRGLREELAHDLTAH